MIPEDAIKTIGEDSYPCTSGDDPVRSVMFFDDTELSLHKRG